MTDALAMLGDWNCPAIVRGRYSPGWIAGRSGMRVVHAGPGRHGNIDYGLVRGASCMAVRHTPPAGADHDVIVFRLSHGREHLRVGSWNVRYGRPPATVRAQVDKVLHAHDLDVLVLQEAADYHQQLRLIPGYACLADERPGMGHQVILMRYGHRMSHPKTIRTSPRGWTLVTGGRHRPLYVASMIVDDWLRIIDVHKPPSVRWRRGVPYGPPMRVAAYIASSRKLLRIARR